VICDSQHDFELFSKISPRGKIKMIENAVPVEKFLRLGKQKKKNTFLFVGRLSRNKRIDLLIESFAKIAEKEKGCRMQIIGRDFEQLLPELEEKVRQHGLQGNIVFRGEVSEAQLMSAYDESQFFISASAYEGFGIATIEAMAAGAIPVLNNIATFNAFVKDSENGFILDFEKPLQAAERILAIMRLGEKEKEKLRQNCTARANDFSWQGKIGEYIEVYNDLFGKRVN
jgi:alpha-1,3-mannosyltransferase